MNVEGEAAKRVLDVAAMGGGNLAALGYLANLTAPILSWFVMALTAAYLLVRIVVTIRTNRIPKGD